MLRLVDFCFHSQVGGSGFGGKNLPTNLPTLVFEGRDPLSTTRVVGLVDSLIGFN